MAEPVGVDPAALRTLADRMAVVGDELATVPIPEAIGWAGSALTRLEAPRRAAVELHRLATAVHDWAATVRRSAEQLAAAEQASAAHLGSR